MGRFGDKFRKEREKKEISLDDVSRVTKITSRMLQAIEEEQFDRLPGGVFNKGFIRAYAKHLGLNDEEAVSEYLACLRQEQVDAQSSWQPSTREGAPPKRPIPPMSKQPSLAPVERVESNGKEEAPTVQPPAPAKPAPPPPVAQNVELPDLQLPRAEDLRPLRPAHVHSGQSGQGGMARGIIIAATVILALLIVLWRRDSHSSHAATSAASAPAAQSNSAPGIAAQNQPAPSTSPAATVDDENGDPNRPVPAKNRAAIKNVAPMLTLVIRASENSWISVSADGQTASRENLIAPAHTSVRASHDLVVKVGNAAGVSFLFNGKEIPPQGRESEAQTFVFDSSGLKSSQSAPTAN